MYGILRPEARPLNIETLTRPQLEALKQILATIETAEQVHSKTAELAHSKAYRRPDRTRLDTSRSSRILFLSGEPGTGRTTVYLTLRNALESRAPSIPGRECSGPSDAPHEQKLFIDLEDLDRRFKRLRDRVIWLEPLNLETIAGTTTNYLAAILARIDRLLAEELKKRPGNEIRTPSLFEHGELSEALAEFQRLRADIGLAWDGNLPQRGEHLDPDVYAEEVMRAENARIQVSDRFRKVIEDLMDELFQSSQPPLFLLAVDDLYVNPETSWELLRLLRMVSIPHLFILAIGEYRVLEDLMYQCHLGQLVQLAGERAFRLPAQERILTARARQTSFETTRKLLPPAQRVTIEVPYWNEATELSPAKSSLVGDNTHPVHKYTLGELLELLPLDLDFGFDTDCSTDRVIPSTLMEFLRLPGTSILKRDGKRSGRLEDIKDADAYLSMQLLEAPPRSIHDLWFAIQKMLQLSKYDPKITWKNVLENRWASDGNRKYCRKETIGMVVGQALQALNEQAYLRFEDLEIVENAIKGSLYVQQKLDTERLEVLAETKIIASLDLERFSSTTNQASEIYPIIELRSHHRWRMRPNSSTASADPLYYQDFLPPRPVAWFVLLHDLLVLSRDEGIIGAPLTANRLGQEWAGVRWKRRYARPWESSDTSIFIPWPTPRWPSFWQFDTFLCAWNHIIKLATGTDNHKGVNGKEKPENNHLFESLVYWWIRLAVSVFRLENSVLWLTGDDSRVFRMLKREHLLRGIDPLRDNTGTYIEEEDDAWPALRKDLQTLLDETRKIPLCEQPEALADAERWLLHLAVMMTPEYGLSKEIVERLLKCEPWINGRDEKKGQSLWQRREVVGYIRNARAEVLERFLGDNLDPDRNWQGIISWSNNDRNVLIFSEHRFEDGEMKIFNSWNPLFEDIYCARKRRYEAENDEKKMDVLERAAEKRREMQRHTGIDSDES